MDELEKINRKPATNSTYPKGGVSCSKDRFVVIDTLVLLINFCVESPALRVAPKRCGAFKKTMTRLTNIITILIFMTSCNNSHNDQTIEFRSTIDTNNVSQNQDTLFQVDKEQDTIQLTSKNTTNTAKSKHQNNKPNSQPVVRMIDFPCDENFNGKPMTQQENISKTILEMYPDTLTKLAIARYKTYDHFFPKSIADNFEKGISTERIHYPEKLIFRFELFENEVSLKPYIVKEVVVRRNTNGELYTE